MFSNTMEALVVLIPGVPMPNPMDWIKAVSNAKNVCKIFLDIRYALFIIDKFAGAGYLLDEMTLVE